MDILIISTNRNANPSPVFPAGACMVSEAAERAGHTVRLLDLMFQEDPLGAVKAELKRRTTDVVGLSVRNIDNNDMRNPAFFVQGLAPMIKVIKKQTNAMVVLGGPATGVMPEEMLRYTGACCAVVGEGDVAFPELLRNSANFKAMTKTPGTAWILRGEFMENPARSYEFSGSCCVPDYGKWIDVGRYFACMATVPVQAKLGCHYRCVYCTYRKIEGSNYRCCSPESVADAVERYVLSGIKDIEFVDNVFNSPYAHAMEICRLLAASHLRCRAQSIEMNPACLDDELLAAMERAGFVGIGITAESASDIVLESLKKGFTSRDVHRAADVIGRHSIPCLWIFMLGGPGETRGTVRETLKFAETRVRGNDVAFFNIGVRIYPGTELETLAREEGLLSVPREDMLRPVFYFSPLVDFRWVVAEVKRAMKRNMNFIDSDSIGFSFLPRIHTLGYRFGIRPPLWRYARYIRRGLNLMGIDA